MATDKTRIVTYVNDEVAAKLEDERKKRGLRSTSAAAEAILTEFATGKAPPKPFKFESVTDQHPELKGDGAGVPSGTLQPDRVAHSPPRTPGRMTVVPDAPEPKRPQQFKLADGRMFTDLSRVKRADDEATAPTQRFSPAINAEPVHEAADAAGADDVAEDAPAFSTAPPPSKFQQNDKPEPRVDLRGVLKPREIDPDMPFLEGEPDVHGWRNEAGR